MRLAILAALMLALTTSCGGGGTGAEVCELYQAEMADAPEAIASTLVLNEIKGKLADADAETRRAFAALITAADANPYSGDTDPNALNVAAADVRSTCLAEHGLEIESP